MNPYVSHLGDSDPLAVIATTSGELQRLSKALGSERLEHPLGPGKWSPRQIFCHLADAEVAFAFRLRQALAEDHHVIQPSIKISGRARIWVTKLMRRLVFFRRSASGISS